LSGAPFACKEEAEGGDKAGGGGETGDAWRPDLVCPGDAGCETNEGAFQAGAAALPITPTCFESWTDLDGSLTYSSSQDSFNDCGCDRLCEGDEGYPGPDAGEADGEFQPIWIAGFGQGRAATDVHDDTWARAAAFRSGDTTVALVSLDLVGLFNNDVVRIRDAVKAAGVDVDHVVVQSTHVHETADTLGQWGSNFSRRGVNDDYLAYVISQSAAAVQQAVAQLEPATLTTGVIDSAAPFGAKGTRNTVRDSRDPVVIEERVKVAWLTGADGHTISTLVNWGNHPEVLGGDNTLITSDYVHYLRQGVEQGVSWDSGDRAGLGGVCVFVEASVGGLMTPLGITVTDMDGADFEGDTWEKAEALGKVVADLALQAAAGGSEATEPRVAVSTTRFFVPVENYAFQALFLLGTFDRPIFNYDPDRDLDETNIPDLETEVNLVTVGPIRMLSIPGELTPELAIGGYDGSRVNTDEVELIKADNPNPPDLSLAPTGPYFEDLMGGEQAWIIGLGNDEIGYLIPPYDYKLNESSPYLVDAEGDHYEETNSVGPSAAPAIIAAVEALTGYTP
jgi:hypothetical protein